MTVFVVLILATLQACIERTDTGISGKPSSSGSNAGWSKAGEFGGFAVEVTSNPDPKEQRFENGKFLLLSGICATNDEVWACDLEISRIQVFDFNGNHKRNIGLGCPIEGTLLSPVDVFYETQLEDFPRGTLWEDSHGNTWRARKRELFKAGDVEVVPGGYFFADSVLTSLRTEPMREFGVYFAPDEGGIMSVDIGSLTFPSYLAVNESTLAVSDPALNSLWAAYSTGAGWTAQNLVVGIDFRRYMTLQEYYSDTSEYLPMLYRLTHSGQKAGEFVLIGGLDIAYNKLVVCDTGNRRLQIVSMVHYDASRFGKAIRTIWGTSTQGEFRFHSPLDISIAIDGTMYVIDAGELEVVILDAGFNRIGSFGKGDLVEPYAIDLSDDGKHCYISDRRENIIHHYVTNN